MNYWQEGLGNLHVTTLRDGGMKIPSLSKRRVTAPGIGGDGGAWRNDTLDEATQRFGTSVWHHRETNTSGVSSSPALVEAATVLALFNLDRTGDENHIVNASALAASTAADVGFIGFDVICGVATNLILVGPYHADPQFVKNLESSLVAWQSELPLELEGRHPGSLTGDQVGCPEPHRERCVRTFHDRASGEASFTSTLPATKDTGPSAVAIGFASRFAVGADKSTAPSSTLKVGRACRFIREHSLKLRKRAGERQIVSLKNVDDHDFFRLKQGLNILLVVGVCDNRISTVSSIKLICVPLSCSLERPNFQRLSVTSSWVSLSILAWRYRMSLSRWVMIWPCCAILAINSETSSRSCSAFKLGRDSRATTMHSSVPVRTIYCYWRMP